MYHFSPPTSNFSRRDSTRQTNPANTSIVNIMYCIYKVNVFIITNYTQAADEVATLVVKRLQWINI